MVEDIVKGTNLTNKTLLQQLISIVSKSDGVDKLAPTPGRLAATLTGALQILEKPALEKLNNALKEFTGGKGRLEIMADVTEVLLCLGNRSQTAAQGAKYLVA